MRSNCCARELAGRSEARKREAGTLFTSTGDAVAAVSLCMPAERRTDGL
jgi:hypothetical protein